MSDTTQDLEWLLKQWRSGDDSKKELLIARAIGRLRILATSRFAQNDRLRRHFTSDDVLNEAWQSLDRALEAEQPKTAASFFRISSLVIWRTITNLARSTYGPLGHGANEANNAEDSQSPVDAYHNATAKDSTPSRSLAREETRKHLSEVIDELTKKERALFDLRVTYDMTFSEAGEILGISAEAARKAFTRIKRKLGTLLREVGLDE